jgi:hypothetical protein
MKIQIAVSALAATFCCTSYVAGFTLSKVTVQNPHFDQRNNNHRRVQPLYMSGQFDISNPVFDLLSFRSVRGDALVRYDALNQSEPLRITLFSILCLTCLAAPSLSEAVGYDEMGLPATIGSFACAAASAGLLFRECSRRAKQLTRIEKELNTELLPIRIPTNALADRPFSKPVTLKALKDLTNPPRIIAICGTQSKLQEALQGLSIIGRRLKQASVYVVAVPTDGSKASDWGMQPKTPWLADAHDLNQWLEYFDSLAADADMPTNFRWFGLNASGRSFGSGENEIPLWLELLGQHLRPTELLDESDAAVSRDQSDAPLLKSLETFYGALTTGDQDGIDKIFSQAPSDQVSLVTQGGGRIDSWEQCLVEGARPEDMKVSGADSMVLSETEAYTTAVEFPANAGIDSATLLAVQRWTRSNADDDWKLELHQTIPWSPEAKAQGTLRCDCRGCVALTRGPERRTFGGVIG